VSTTRQKMLKLLHGEDPGEIIVCPLIDSWVLEDRSEKAPNPEEVDEYYTAYAVRGPVEDQIHMGEICGYDPVALQDIDWTLANPKLQWKEEQVSEDPVAKKRVDRLTLHTPYGDIVRRRESSTISAAQIDESELPAGQLHKIIEWYADELMCCDLDLIREQIKGYTTVRGERGLLSSAVTDPWGLFGLLGRRFDAAIYHHMDYPEEHKRLADRVLEVAKFQADIILENDYDFIWNGGIGGITITSPQYYRATRMPYAKEINDYVKSKGGLIYSHDCGRSATMIRQGLYNELAPSCLETLAPPPAGDIDDLRTYREMLDPSICTKGNVDVGFLLHASVEEVQQATLDVIEATRGFRHMVGTGDDVYDGTPLENLTTMVEVAKNYTGRHLPSAEAATK
jgi:hypothetical protein